MHAFLDNGLWIEWTGQRIDGVAHPRNILTLWQTAELEAVGLYEVEIDPVPEGKVATSWALEDRAGRPAYVPVLVDYVPTSADVNAERDRRIIAGATITVIGLGSIPIQGGDKHERNLSGLAQAASLRLMSNDNTTVTVFRDAINVNHDMLPFQVIELWQKAAGYVSELYQASWAIKELDPIPLDFDDDSRWPSSIR